MTVQGNLGAAQSAWAARLTRWRLQASAWELQHHLRAAEKVLPLVVAALPVDRRHRATWGFQQLKDALGHETGQD